MLLFAESKAKSSPIEKPVLTNITKSIKTCDSSEIHKEKKNIENIDSFKQIGISDWLCKVVKSIGYKAPFDIQSECIPAIINGNDVIGISQTGSGKTAAFALPILQILSNDIYGIFCLVITPTRELAIQIADQFQVFGSAISLKLCVLIGGMNMIEQKSQLAKKPHIVIGTPGRIYHLLESADPPDLKKIRFLVLDEADRLLATGFENELRTILYNTSNKRQTLLFSASMTTSIEKISELTSKDTLKFDLISKSRSNVPSTLSQEYLFMPSKMKLSFLFAYLESISTDEENEKSTIKKKSKLKSQSQSQDCVNIKSPVIIFVNTCKRCEEIKEFLLNLNFNCVALHSNMNQNFRSNSLSQFKNFNSKILVATDIASRGLDIPNVGYVINFDVPKVHTDYLHRVGRTARAGEVGKSVTFINPNEVDILKDIESYTNTKMNLVEGIKLDEISKNLNKVSKALRLAQIKLLEEGFDDTKSNNFKRKRQN